jgi:hypothetical protein
MVPPRSAQKRRPSGENASAVAKFAEIVRDGGDCGPTPHLPLAGIVSDLLGDGDVDVLLDGELAAGFGDPDEHATKTTTKKTLSPARPRRRTACL